MAEPVQKKKEFCYKLFKIVGVMSNFFIITLYCCEYYRLCVKNLNNDDEEKKERITE